MKTQHHGAARKNAGTPLRIPFLPLLVALLVLVCATGCATTASPQGLYHAVWKATPEHIYDPDMLPSWQLWEHRYDGRLHTQEDAERAIAEMLAATGDRYTYFMDPPAVVADTARRESTAPSVTTRILDGNIGYLRLNGFHQNDEIAQFKAGLEELKDCKALVIDMRGNLGGLVYNAVETAAFFIPQGKVVTIRHRIPGSGYRTEVVRLTQNSRARITTTDQSAGASVEVRPRQPYLANGRPVVVLVNGHSASATELFVGAVKDNGVATIIGTRTYGKGIGQSNIDMPNGTRLHVTSLRYFTPNGTWIGDGGNTQPLPHGIMPDITVEPSQGLEIGGQNDNQLEKAIELLKEKLGRTSGPTGTTRRAGFAGCPGRVDDAAPHPRMLRRLA